MLKKEMGKRIEETRESQGMTRESMAERTGISTKFLYEVERGKKGISAQTLLKLADTLSVSTDYLLKGEKESVMWEGKKRLSTLDPEKVRKIEKILELILEL